MDEKEVVERNDKGQFPAGTSGNPKGRPKGSKNQVTLYKLIAEEAVRAENADDMLAVARLIVEQALDGDSKSQQLVWNSMMSKGTSDDKTQAKEKVEINIGGIAAPPEVKQVTEIQVIEQTEEPTNGEQEPID